MDPPNVLWFFGAFAIEVGVYALIETIPDDQGGVWRFVASLGFFLGFAVAAWLLVRRWWWVPGGLGAALSVGAFPAAAVAFLQLIDVWPEDPFFQPFSDFSGYWLGVALVSAAVGLVAYGLTRFQFIFAISIGFVIAAGQLLVPAFEEPPSGDDRAATALVVGAALVIVGVFLDTFGRRRDAFWFHTLGWLTVAAGLVFFTVEPDGDVNRGWIPMLIVGVLMLVVAGPIRRASWAVYGVLGMYAATVHFLTNWLNESRWPFALSILALALSIFALGVAVHRYGQVWAGRFVRRPPPTPGP
jgi:hypothetical protein